MEIIDKEEQFQTKPIVLQDDKNFFVIVGANNSGKSTFLRSILKTVGGASGYLVTVNRTLLTGEALTDDSYGGNYQAYLNQAANENDDNHGRNIQPLRDIFNLKNDRRKSILDWYNKYFTMPLEQKRMDIDNDASPMLLKVGEHSITKQGSGMRATLEIFIKLLDPSVKVLCIDEPELGLEPYLQKYLFEALKDMSGPNKKIIIATHSHHFIDIRDADNNYVCSRNSDNKISIEPISNLKDVIFRLLGNTLSSFLLPEKIIVLEGPSDTTFLNKCLNILSKENYGIHNSGGNDNVSYAINSITNFLKFNEKNLPVYKNNTFVIVDNPLKDVLIREWKKLLGDDSRLLVLKNNAIEYYYPERILQEIFDTSSFKEDVVKTYLGSNPNGFNSVDIPKTKLSTIVSEKISSEDLNDIDNELFVFLKALP